MLSWASAWMLSATATCSVSVNVQTAMPTAKVMFAAPPERGLLAVEAEGGRANCGRGTDVDGVFGRRDGGGSRHLASGDARRLRAGCLGESGGEGTARGRPFPLMWI